MLAQRRGHSIEIRINAENPAGGRFLPSPGTITRLTPPDGFGTRFDGGYESGDTISQFYDNLIGKLIVWGRDRPVAIARAIRALEEMVVEGVATTIPADLAILRHPDFQQATHSTKWVEERLDLSGVERPQAPQPTEDGAAPLVERSDHRRGRRQAVRGDAVGARVGTGHRRRRGRAAPRGPQAARAASAAAAGGGSGEVAVPMQGTIVKVLVEVGAAVEAGQPVVVLEAMKMENQIQAEVAGTVSQVKVAPGDTVGAGDVVVVIS